MVEMKSGRPVVYKIVHKPTQIIIYVGETEDSQRREHEHYSKQKINKAEETLRNAYDAEAFEFIPEDPVGNMYNKEERLALERTLIQKYQPICNLHPNDGLGVLVWLVIQELEQGRIHT